MKQLHLITGFLGAGKTTFLKLYASRLLSMGKRIGIVANDYGAVNVDMMLLKELESDNCSLEMISGGCDADCHKRRFKTKLIALGMQPFDEVLIEPSGLFDTEEYFDVLEEEPVDSWYTAGNVIAVIDSKMDLNMTPETESLFISQIANAGILLFSKMSSVSDVEVESLKSYINSALLRYGCSPKSDTSFLAKPWEKLTDSDWDMILHCGHNTQSFPKSRLSENSSFSSLYYMNLCLNEKALLDAVSAIFKDSSCGNVIRIKGFFQKETGEWYELNATTTGITFVPISDGQNVIIVIGEHLNDAAISSHYTL